MPTRSRSARPTRAGGRRCPPPIRSTTVWPTCSQSDSPHTDRGRPMADCTHLDTIDLDVTPSSTEGCSECLRTGGWWVHLRECMTCGEVGCCDNSPNKHATAHYHATAHPIVRSREPGEHWFWCYVDEVAFELDTGAPA